MDQAKKITVFPIGSESPACELAAEARGFLTQVEAKLDDLAELFTNHTAVVSSPLGPDPEVRYFRFQNGRKSAIARREFNDLRIAAYRVVSTLQGEGNTTVDYYAQKAEAYAGLEKIRDEYVKCAILVERATSSVIASGSWATSRTGRPIAWQVTREEGSPSTTAHNQTATKPADTRPYAEAQTASAAPSTVVSIADLVESGVAFPFEVKKVTEDERFWYVKGTKVFPLGTILTVVGVHETENDLYKAVDFSKGHPHNCNGTRRHWVLQPSAKTTQKHNPEKPNPMEDIIGMDSVKEKIREIVAKYKLSITHSLETSAPKMVFAGNPGTGKTTVASDVASSLCQIGVLRSPVVKFVSGADLKARYVGHTAPHINKIFDDVEAKGQLLLIDEVYSLFSRDGSDMTESASDAVGTLLTRIERLAQGSAVVLAGYPDKLRDFFAVNQGLISRVQDVVIFKDFTTSEALAILKARLKTLRLSSGTPEEEAALEPVLEELVSSLVREPSFANGRTIRNLAEHVFRKLAVRMDGKTARGDALVVQASDFTGFLDSGSILSMLTGEMDAKKETPRIGFVQ